MKSPLCCGWFLSIMLSNTGLCSTGALAMSCLYKYLLHKRPGAAFMCNMCSSVWDIRQSRDKSRILICICLYLYGLGQNCWHYKALVLYWTTNMTSLEAGYILNEVSLPLVPHLCVSHNIPNCMKEVTWLSYGLCTNGHRSAALGWLPFILPPVFVHAAVIRSW